MTDLRTAAQQALAWLGPDAPECCGCREEWQQAIDVLRAALAEHYCDNHCTWLDHAPGCVRAEPQTTHWEGCSAVHPECAKAEAARIRAAMQRLTDVQQELEADLSRCPKCNGPADNGHDRSIPPNPYWCSRCMAEPTVTSDCQDGHQLTDEVIADLWHQNGGFHHHFARAIERWLKGNP